MEHFKIDLRGVTGEGVAFEHDLGDEFFDALDVTEVQGGALHVSVSIRKVSGLFELLIHAAGTVNIPCDRCLEQMAQPVEGDSRYVVRLGSDNGSEEDDVIAVDEEEGILDTAWPVYETIALAIPIQHVHAPGKCNPAMTEALEKLSADRSGDEESSCATDPRWEKLLKLRMKSEE